MKREQYIHKDCLSFVFTPERGEILDGVKSAYVDVSGRLHLSIGYSKDKKEFSKIRKRNDALLKKALRVLTVNPKDLVEKK